MSASAWILPVVTSRAAARTPVLAEPGSLMQPRVPSPSPAQFQTAHEESLPQLDPTQHLQPVCVQDRAARSPAVVLGLQGVKKLHQLM